MQSLKRDPFELKKKPKKNKAKQSEEQSKVKRSSNIIKCFNVASM